MLIIGLGTALPARSYAQRESWGAVQHWPQFSQLKLRSRAILKKVLCGNNGIDSRPLALETLAEAFDQTPDDLQARFAAHAPALAAAAARNALKDAGCQADEMDAVIISTCTGYLCPGLTSYVSEQLGLRQNVIALDLVGQGCGAALPNLRAGEAILAAGRAKKVLSICVEVCSAAFFIDDDPARMARMGSSWPTCFCITSRMRPWQNCCSWFRNGRTCSSPWSRTAQAGHGFAAGCCGLLGAIMSPGMMPPSACARVFPAGSYPGSGRTSRTGTCGKSAPEASAIYSSRRK